MKLNLLFTSALVGIFLLGIFVGRITGPELAFEDVLSIEGRTAYTSIEPTQNERAPSPLGSESLFGAVSTDRFEQMARTAAASSDAVENEAMLVVLVSEWARRDPRAAIAFAKELKRDDLVYEGYLQWARYKPNEALRWIEQNEQNAGQRRYLTTAVYRGIAKTDPLDAVQRLDQMAVGAQRDELMSIVVDEWANQDVYAAFEWLETTELTPAFSSIYSQVMGRYIEQDPVTAAALVSEMNACEDKVSFASQVAVKLAELNVDHALEWVNSLKDDRAKKYAFQGVIDRWSKGDEAEAALSYLMADSNHKDFKNLFTTVAMNLSYGDPDLLTQAFDQMNNVQKMISAQQLASVLSVEDPNKGMEWVRSLSSGAVKDIAIENALRSYKKTNVSDAFELSETISDNSSRREQMHEVLKVWISVDQEAAERALYASAAIAASEKEDLLNRIYQNLKPSDYVLPAKN